MGNNERNSNLDLLKGICILLVVFTHYAWEDGERLMLGFPFWVDMAVPMFMLVSGYVYAKSYIRKGITTLDGAYTAKNILPPLIRYTVPYLLAYGVEVTACAFYQLGGANLLQGALGDKEITLDFGNPWGGWNLFTGGFGPGSYYWPVMVQFVLFFPFLYQLVRKYKGKAVVAVFCVNVFLEALKISFGVTEGLYRLLAYRYLFLIAYGVYCAIGEVRLNVRHGLALGVGLSFLVMTNYLGYEPKIFMFWTRTCAMAGLYAVPFFVLFLAQKEGNGGRLLKKMGRCSYDIFLVQKVYYAFAASLVYRVVAGKAAILLHVLVTVTVGFLFFRIENTVTKKVLAAAKARLGMDEG